MKTQKNVQDHYDSSAINYHLQYERNLISDLNRVYPANYFRLHLLLKSFLTSNIKRIVEVGVGEGTPLITLSNAGIDVSGFDISHEMVKKARENFKKNNLNPEKLIWGDIEDPITYCPILKDGQFDALLAMGVLPHTTNDEFVLRNMRQMVKPGGRVFIEFRNKLFSLFTFNRHTYDFIMNDLLKDVGPEFKKIIALDLKNRLEMDKPKQRLIGESAHLTSSYENDSSPGYDAILSKFHNPFEVIDLFKKCGYIEPNLLWYHYHPAMPYLEPDNKALFRDESLKLEHETSGWRGLFLCSAFVVEAINPMSV